MLVEPVQRISRYSMLLKEIIQLTPKDHQDYCSLRAAYIKIKEIATMADDDPTKTATMFLNLYQAIADSPCSLINQKRSLIGHLDAIEMHRETNKLTRAVSLFLFSDKVLIASRSSNDAKEIDIDELVDMGQTRTRLTLSKKAKYKNYGLSFKGWADIETIDILEGVTECPGSFILSATFIPDIQNDNDYPNINSFEKYCYKGPRLYTVLAPTESYSSSQMDESLGKLHNFMHLYRRTKALAKQHDKNDKTLYKSWKNNTAYINSYTVDTYNKSKYKNDCVLIYVDDTSFSIKDIFNRLSPATPSIIGLIQPEDSKGFRFSLSTKYDISNWSRTRPIQQTNDFESVFWNNRECYVNVIIEIDSLIKYELCSYICESTY
ncbi:hypothetical protein BDB01DRAFT_751464 [Pilobolus umbonatus]|nr:hypothetical protein BDB01DRAFT_751464 [Pilobolus umbonatus]